jgi:uncharacterized membrane protein
MTIAVWIVSGILAALYLFAGVQKTFLPEDKIMKSFPYTETTGLRVTRIVGVLEIIGAIGLILPALTGIAPILSAFAALGLVLIQVGAVAVHIRRNEYKMLPMNLVLLLLAAFVAVGRFLGY